MHCFYIIGLQASVFPSSLCKPGCNDDRHNPQNFSGRIFLFVAVNFQPMWLLQCAHSAIVQAYLKQNKKVHVKRALRSLSKNSNIFSCTFFRCTYFKFCVHTLETSYVQCKTFLGDEDLGPWRQWVFRAHDLQDSHKLPAALPKPC